MSRLSNRLHAWALNEEMINTHYTEHGCDCVSASELLVQQDAEIERLRSDISYLESQNSKTIHRAATEITRLRHMLDDVLAEVELPQSIEKRVREALGE